MLVYIPKALDIDAVIAQNPPNFTAFKKDFLLYVIDRILMRSQFKKDKIYFGYVPLLSTLLQEIKPNYKAHLMYLIEQGIIDCNNTYKKNRNPKGYRLKKKWGYEVKAVQLADFKIISKLKNLRKKDEMTTNEIKYLTKWYNDKLEIDSELVNAFLLKRYEQLIGKPELWARKRIKGRKELQVKQPSKQYQNGLLSALRLCNNDIYLKRDNTSRRLHHNLSNMPSILRHAITYDGNRLYSIDIKNSQPFLSLCLFNPSFWDEKNRGESDENHCYTNGEAQNTSIFFFLFKINIITKYSLKTRHHLNYTMLGDIMKPLLNKDFVEFTKLVSSGRFYEILKTQFENLTGTEMERSEVKEIVFLIIFGGNKGGTSEDIAKKKIFKNLFPDVYKVFSAIKRNQKEVLSCLLQTIESYLILEVIAKRISKEYPQAPLFTIHDSIATTAEYVKEVESIMIEELTLAIGYKPTLDTQEWNPNILESFIKDKTLTADKAA